MMKMQKKSDLSTDKNDRRRGRPAGKNRTPLSLEERRARNAQYERERRNETADAMAQLAEAARCDPQIANAELLATVINQLHRRTSRKVPQEIENLKRTNKNIESQIAELQSRLGHDIDVDNIAEELSDPEELNEISEPCIQEKKKTKGKRQEKKVTKFQSTIKDTCRSKKIRKTSKSSSVREKAATESDTQTYSSNTDSDWSETVKRKPKQYKLRERSQKLSEQSERTTSTYLTRTESESSHCAVEQSLKLHSEDWNLSDESEHEIIDPALLTVPERTEKFTENGADHVDSELLETLTENEKRIINDWLDGSETVDTEQEHVDNKVLNFLEFDDFMLDIQS